MLAKTDRIGRMGTERYRGEMPCMCGEGFLIGERSEHDVYGSRNQNASWNFTCTTCSDKYEVVNHGGERFVVNKSEYEKYRQLAYPGFEAMQSAQNPEAFKKKAEKDAAAYWSNMKVCKAPSLHFCG